MKKILFLAVIIALVTVAFTACHLAPQDESSIYTELNDMANKSYSNVNLSVQTTKEGVTLNSTYTISNGSNNTMVTYSMERLAIIEQDQNGNFVMPDDMIVTKSGSAVIKDGQVVEQSGDAADVPIKSLSTITLNFNEDYFSMPHSYDENDTHVFKADVSDPKGFTANADFDGKNMSIEVLFKEQLESVKINYTSANGAEIKVTYSFR